MDNIINAELVTDDPNELKKLIDQYLEILRLMNERAKMEWQEIEMIKEGTRAMLDTLRKAA